MPDQSYTSMEEKLMPVQKAAKDMLTLLFDGNASVDTKLKSLLDYYSENLKTLKLIAKGSLPLVRKSKLKTWVTDVIVQDWSLNHIIPEINIPWRRAFHSAFFLLLNSVPGHPPFMDNFRFTIKVVHMSLSIASLIQPMDHVVI